MEKILIIEDDKTYLDNIKILLEEEDYNVIAVSNGLDGIDTAKNDTPDLIICDIMLPDIDGFSILKEFRKREKTRFIPFIFLTAKSTMDNLRTGMNLGADDYITKPFRSEDLLMAIKTRLEKSKAFYGTKNNVGLSLNNKKKLGPDDHIFLPAKDNYEVLPLSKIVCIVSESVYTNVFSENGKKVLVRKLLKEWEDTLPGSMFLRIHKSYIINVKYINKIEKWFNGALKLSLNNFNESLIVSRRYASRVKKSI
jgi:DNA-binding LytR/AlgR family response regulator